MTNTLAIILALAIAAMLALDAMVLHWDLPVVVGRQLVRLVEWASFWR